MRSLLLIILCTVAFAKRRPPESHGLIHWGSCALKDQNYEVFRLCMNTQAEVSGLFFESDPQSNRSMFYSDLYHGFHLGPWMSVHGSYFYFREFMTARQGVPVRVFQETEELFLQLGNVAHHKWRLSAGRIDSAFGLDYQPIISSVSHALKNFSFWREPELGLKLTYDTMVSSSFDVSVHTNQLGHPSVLERESPRQALSFRAMFDVAAMEGFRFLFSGYGDDAHERRISIGLLNKNQKGDETSFEWVRKTKAGRLREEYEQIFRLSFISAMRSQIRWIVDFESERLHHRMGILGTELELPDYGKFRFYIGLENAWERSGAKDRLFFASAVGVAL